MLTAAVSLSDVLASLSYALDLTEGQTAGHAIRSCLVAMRLAGAVGLDAETRSALHYAVLLKDTGGSSNAERMAALFGSDDHIVKRRLRALNWPRKTDAVISGIRSAGIGRPLPERVRHMSRIALTGSRNTRELVQLRAQRGAEIARRLELPEATAQAIHALDEHWDGRGHPEGLVGEAIPLLARIVGLAQTVEVIVTDRGVPSALQTIRALSGTWFDPALVETLAGWGEDDEWWTRAWSDEAREMVRDTEPAEAVRRVDESQLDRVAESFAEIVDAKTAFTSGHSSRVAAYARGIAEMLGMDADAQRRLYRAGLLHDIGKLAVSNRILEKPGPLNANERQAIVEHATRTWELLSRVDAFREVARLAALHHERLDGSGYPWRLTRPQLSAEARALAVADTFEAMTSWRPYCAEVPPDTAIFLLKREADERFDADAIAALERRVIDAGDQPARGVGDSAPM